MTDCFSRVPCCIFVTQVYYPISILDTKKLRDVYFVTAMVTAYDKETIEFRL